MVFAKHHAAGMLRLFVGVACFAWLVGGAAEFHSEDGSDGSTVVALEESDSSNDSPQISRTVLTGMFGLAGVCMAAERRDEEASSVAWAKCDEGDKGLIFDFDTKSDQLRNHYGICVGATSANVTGAMVEMRHCDLLDAQQRWQYNPATGQIKMRSSVLCLAQVNKTSENGLVEQGVGLAPCTIEMNGSQQWDVVVVSVGGTDAIDCTVTAWTEFTECTKSCGTGEQKRLRAIIKAAENGGATCPKLIETRSCSTWPCPKDPACEVGPWGEFSQCSHMCGGGVQHRTRTVLVEAAGLGTGCPELEEGRNCNTHACSVQYEGQGEHGHTDDHMWPGTAYNETTKDPHARLEQRLEDLERQLHHMKAHLVSMTAKKRETLQKLHTAEAELEEWHTGAAAQRCEERVLMLARVTVQKDYLTGRLKHTDDTLTKARAGNVETLELLTKVSQKKERLETQIMQREAKATAQHANATLVQAARVAKLQAEKMSLADDQKELLTEQNETRTRCKEKVRQLAFCKAEKSTLVAKLARANTVATKARPSGKPEEEMFMLQSKLEHAETKATQVQGMEQKQSTDLADCRSNNNALLIQVQECDDERHRQGTEMKQKGEDLTTCMVDKGTISADLETALLKLNTVEVKQAAKGNPDVTGAEFS